ncbi:MAG: S8 family serine peptidase [Myxococcales bacterium]|nr:S8 family serine peptidase [Myxococcales bacterium]
MRKILPLAFLALALAAPARAAERPVRFLALDRLLTPEQASAIGVRVLEVAPGRGAWVEVLDEAALEQNGARIAIPAWAEKLSPGLREQLGAAADSAGPLMLRAVTARGRSARSAEAALRSRADVRAELAAWDDSVGRGYLWLRADSAADLHRASQELASRPEVVRVELYRLPVLKNDNSSWLIQSGSEASSRSIWRHGITGFGEVIGVADSGLDADACQFRFSADRASVTLAVNAPQPPGAVVDRPENKVLTYYVIGSAEAYDDASGDFHGTHTVGDAAGDNYANLATATAAGHDSQDGMAPGARVVFQDIGDSAGYLSGLMNVSMADLLRQAYDTGARVHNNSYGFEGLMTGYDMDSASIDAATWKLNDLVVVFAAGNAGADDQGRLVPQSLGGTGSTAKNTVVAGASGPVELDIYGSIYHLQDDLMFFSSQGPTADGRIKPDLVAPGLVFSATSDRRTAIDLGCCDAYNNRKRASNNEDDNCNVDTGWPTMGTSFSSPITAGAAALVREYFRDGFWYAGRADANHAFNPSSALVKAMLLNGAAPLAGRIVGMGADYDLTSVPSFEQGWGRLHLEGSLWFEEDQRLTIVLNDTPNPAPDNPMLSGSPAPFPGALPALHTGDEVSWDLPVADPAEPLRITLVWADPAAAPGATPALVNDLNLKLVDPHDNLYLGNMNFGGGRSYPVFSPDSDRRNNVESIILDPPEAASYRLTVKAAAVPGNGETGSDGQGYALVISGTFRAPTPSAIEPARGKPGETLSQVTVRGENFVPGMTLELGEGVTASGIEVLDGQTARIGSLAIDAQATEGKRDVTARLFYNLAGTGANLFQVGGGGSGGCGCGAAPQTSLAWLLPAGFLYLLRPRRRNG